MAVVQDNLDLAVRRKRLGLTQTEVAGLIGITDHSAVSRFERKGERLPHGRTRMDVISALDAYERGMAASK